MCLNNAPIQSWYAHIQLSHQPTRCFFYVSKHCTNPELVCTVRFLTYLQVFLKYCTLSPCACVYSLAFLLKELFYVNFYVATDRIALELVYKKQMVKSASAIKHSFIMPSDCGYQYSNREKKKVVYPYFKTNFSFKTAFPVKLLRTVTFDHGFGSGFVSVLDPDSIRSCGSGSVFRIRIREGKNDRQK
jgi:hypothetical protein